MGGTFNPQILVEKLAKLNNSQQSIETLSHWCIFHMNKAKQVVETWDKQFHCSPSEQRLAFLYLANDILQNSRRKGLEFVGEFWKVLPDALRHVIENGDEFGRNAALRLISIWEERKVFGSRAQILKEELVGRHLENSNRNGKLSGFKLRHSAGNALDKIVSGYQVVYGGQLDDDVILGKCRNAISCIEKVDKEIGGDVNSEKLNGSGVVDELQGQHAILRDSIEQLMAVESSRANLVSHLREALQDQEFKLDQLRNQLQAAQSQSEQAGHLCRQLLNNNPQLLAEQSMKETHTSAAPVTYTRQLSFANKSGEDPKAAAAAVAAKLTASTSSAQMLTYVLSSLASEGVIGNAMKDPSGDYPSEKRAKLENDHLSYIPSQNLPPPIPPYPHPDSLQNSVPISEELAANEQPPPPSSPPPLPPLPPMQPFPVPQFMQTAGSLGVPFTYGTAPQQPQPMSGYSPVGPPMNLVSPFTAPPPHPYQSFQGSEGGFYSQPSSLPMAPMSRQ
ncbi:Regulation of nuclear pre-mRNA domain-containing protein [Actinidia chinensis var. chinensis]|uniref:Regulation of nuclear pre-mRNA domain-containing protein n=1 Tax=Actinidia chinensis var. chinensis TaxID=1590841 RepID=A0A2R6RZ56_ACTCC|nr:Regulation of nuclear pre-mRNA domain-containing protein [Actinidia chinensis var. chinensis]